MLNPLLVTCTCFSACPVTSSARVSLSPPLVSLDSLQVKFQVITRDDQEIIVGRLKVPTVRVV